MLKQLLLLQSTTLGKFLKSRKLSLIYRQTKLKKSNKLSRVMANWNINST